MSAKCINENIYCLEMIYICIFILKKLQLYSTSANKFDPKKGAFLKIVICIFDALNQIGKTKESDLFLQKCILFHHRLHEQMHNMSAEFVHDFQKKIISPTQLNIVCRQIKLVNVKHVV